ncbi:MAG TPA: RyR domain-containing protein [Nitrososphaeraceae archaeon]|nr:RyR domain-containing protein [Nitrososphaeraceae archaeon]
MKTEDIARICHEANAAYCLSLGDTSQTDWDNAPDWQKKSAINGVKFHMEVPNGRTPEESHGNWLKEKLAAGWKYGKIKDPNKKEHPCCVPYDKLPEEHKVKDRIFTAIVKACR